jgi:hypothetical protein
MPAPTPVIVPAPQHSSSKKKQRAKPVSLAAFRGPADDTALFDSLGASGELPAHAITFSQFRCGPFFQKKFVLDGETMASVSDLVAKLQEKPELYSSTPRIRITLYQKRIMSIDNRRLKAHQLAGVKIRFTKVEPDQLTGNDLSHIDGSAPSENLHVT